MNFRIVKIQARFKRIDTAHCKVFLHFRFNITAQKVHISRKNAETDRQVATGLCPDVYCEWGMGSKNKLKLSDGSSKLW